MRFYDVTITDTSGATVRQYSSYRGNQSDPGALLCEIDILVTAMHLPIGGSFVRIWGVSLKDIGQASDLNGKNITVSAGMKPGLPLANTQPRPGVIAQGSIFQAFGNWQDTTQTLDIYLQAFQATQSDPANFVFHWAKGQPMATAITNTIKQALPGYNVSMQISPNLVFTETGFGFYRTPVEFATMLNKLSKSIIGGPGYNGVNMVINKNTVTVFDGTSAVSLVTNIQFTDLIGQITWYAPNQVSVKTVLRADINVGDYVKLPPGQVSTQAASLSQYRQGAVFQGVFQVQQVRHVGNSRQPDASSWCSIFNLVGPIDQATANG